MNRLTTVASFDIAVNAQIARNVLEAAGISAVVEDEGIVAMDWLLSNAVDGIKVHRNHSARRGRRPRRSRFWLVILAAIGGIGDLFPIAW